MSVSQLRLVVTAEDFDAALAFYRDALGMPEQAAVTSPGGRVAILDAGRATLELAYEAHAASIDALEVGERVAGHIRVALEVHDADAATSPPRRRSRRRASGGDAVGIPELAPRCAGRPAAHPLQRGRLTAAVPAPVPGPAGTVRRLGAVAPGAREWTDHAATPRAPPHDQRAGRDGCRCRSALARRVGPRAGAMPPGREPHARGPTGRLHLAARRSRPRGGRRLRARRAYDRLGELGVTLAADETTRGIEVTMPLARVGVVLSTLGEWAILPDVVCIDAAPADAAACAARSPPGAAG